jgi:uncharacterized membrane protein
MLRRYIILTILTATLVSLIVSGPALAQENVVHAVFFYHPTCGHCEFVMSEVFPPLREQYGDQLQILEVNTATEEGQALYNASTALYEIPPEWQGVPRLLVGEQYLIGSQQIPQQFPGLIEQYLAEGGVDWPDLPNLPVEEANDEAKVTWRDTYMQDPLGSTLSTVVLVGLIVTMIAVARPRPWQRRLAEQFNPWGFLAIALIGTVAATYLSYVETTQTTAVCGPVGDCNAVQQSEYALLFGFLPIAVLGLLGYFAILAVFVYETWIQEGPYAEWAPAVRFGLTAFGTLFSAGLTFLEPFVIGATCIWCLTSAVSMGLLLLLSAGPGWEVLKPKRRRRRRKRR